MMPYPKKFRLTCQSYLLLLITGLCFACSSNEQTAILVFSKTEGFRHQSIEAGVALFRELGQAQGFEVIHTEESEMFREEELKNFKAVIFLNTTGDVLNHEQQADFERYVQAGGGYLGVHAAADTEYNWPWYGQLVGGYFQSHPAGTPTAIIDVIDRNHISTNFLSERWERTDEWYNYYNLNSEVNVLATLDESTYEGGENGDFHPIAWYHEYDGGRALYTGGGHTAAAYEEDLFVRHLDGALQWVTDGPALNYAEATTDRIPEENRFEVEVLANNLFEPTELVVFDDFRVLFTERRGQLQLYDPATGEVQLAGELDVYDKQEDGLMGLALDPNFADNSWIYLYYSPAGDEPTQNLSRFKFVDNQLDKASEQLILQVGTQRDECCHTGGSIEFDSDGLLYLSTGDDTNPFKSHGYAPIDERSGRAPFDAQGTSGNANDLRGAILRIRVLDDGTYEIPEGNLFPPGTPDARPEIYVMGNRNPYRISIDPKRGTLYWGEVGPDAGVDSVGMGPRGHDEVNQARQAGFFGWPYFVADNKAYWDRDFFIRYF